VYLLAFSFNDCQHMYKRNTTKKTLYLRQKIHIPSSIKSYYGVVIVITYIQPKTSYLQEKFKKLHN